MILVAAQKVHAETFTWSGAYGNAYWQTATGSTQSDELPYGTYGNGWGRTWVWNDSDWSQYYPKSDDAVYVPDGMSLHPNGAESGQGSASTCSTLTLGVGTSLTESATHGLVDIYGTSFVNNGTFSTSLLIHSTMLDVTGTGEIFLNSHHVYSKTNHCALQFSAGQNVHGTGDIGAANTVVDYVNPDITNNGTIRADTSLGVFGWINNTNNGQLVAGNSATLELGGQWTNNNIIRAEDGGAVVFYAHSYDLDGDGQSDGGITGGRLESLGDGVFTSSSGSGFVLRDLTIAARVHVTYNNEHLGFAGNIATEAGAELLFGRTSKTGFTFGTFDLHDDTTLSGSGQTILGYDGQVDVAAAAPGPKTLTIGADHTLIMYQTTHFDQAGDDQIALVNHGVVHYQPILAGAEDMNSTNYVYGGTTNQGRFLIDKPDGSGQVYWLGDITQNTGEFIVDGYLYLNPWGSDHTFQILGGTLGGSGTIRNSTTGVYVGPDVTLSPGNSPGALTISGSLTVGDGADYVVEVSDTDADRLIVTGTLSFEGMLNLILVGDNLSAERTSDLVLFEFGSLDAMPQINITAPADWTWGAISQIGNTLVLNDVVAAPGPTTGLLSLLGLSIMLTRRRKNTG
ncbi:hypothetical protein HED60_24125 [Planctomycetales bacterium ZRK34]|nr:hypothetical protein HED60_24125 [Planctomycetales bacterium ZRK34]